MKDFIGNPLDQEYDEDDEFDLDNGDFFIPNTVIIAPAPPYEGEEEEEHEDIIESFIGDDIDDPDYDYFQDNDGYDSNPENLEFSSEDDDILDDVPHYNIGVSSDDGEGEDLDYVTFPDNETSSKTSTESSTSSSTSRSESSTSEYNSEET